MANGIQTSGAGRGGALPSTGSARGVERRDGGGAGSDLADVLERVLDKGIVVVGDIRVDLLDIELLTVKLRLLIAGVDTARRIGIDWWEHDPWTTGRDEGYKRSLRSRVRHLERQLGVTGDGEDEAEEEDEAEDHTAGSLEEENEALRNELAEVRRELDRRRARAGRERR